MPSKLLSHSNNWQANSSEFTESPLIILVQELRPIPNQLLLVSVIIRTKNLFAPSIRTQKEPTSVSQMISRKKLKKFIGNFIQCLKSLNRISKKPSLILITWLSTAKYTEEKKLKTFPIIVKWQKIINALIPWSVSNWTVPPRPLDIKNFV